jgi:hypothetical protein
MGIHLGIAATDFAKEQKRCMLMISPSDISKEQKPYDVMGALIRKFQPLKAILQRRNKRRTKTMQCW